MACLVSAKLSWASTNSAHGEPLIGILLDPFVLAIAIPLTLGTALVGYVLAVLLLSDTELRRSVPLVAAIVLVVSFLAGPLSIFAPGLILPASVLAMIWSRALFRRPSG